MHHQFRRNILLLFFHQSSRSLVPGIASRREREERGEGAREGGEKGENEREGGERGERETEKRDERGEREGSESEREGGETERERERGERKTARERERERGEKEARRASQEWRRATQLHDAAILFSVYPLQRGNKLDNDALHPSGTPKLALQECNMASPVKGWMEEN